MFNQNSGYGLEMFHRLATGSYGRLFFVGSSSAKHIDIYRELMKVDPNGKVRHFTTLQSAVDAAEDGGNDLILVAPGHVETVTAAGGIDLNKAGLTIVGLGKGSNRPTVNFTTVVTADMDVDAANITLKNFILDLTGIDNLTAPIDVNAAGFRMEDCEIITADAAGQAALGILTDANASKLQLINNFFYGSADAGTAAAVRIVGGNEHVIKGNFFQGNYTTSLGAIDNATTACLRVLVEDNVIINATASSTKAMVFVAGSTGIIRKNHMQILSGTAPITGAAMTWAGANYYAATIATAGTLI